MEGLTNDCATRKDSFGNEMLCCRSRNVIANSREPGAITASEGGELRFPQFDRRRVGAGTHRPIGDDPLTPGSEVEPEAFDFSQAVACELPPGGATFHNGRTLHYTPPKNFDDFRRAYIAMGSAFERPMDTPRRFPWQERQRAAKAATGSAPLSHQGPRN
jgi:hypothetical protein